MTSWWAVGLSAAIATLVIFVIETLMVVSQQQASRPSVWLRAIASGINRFFYNLGAWSGEFSDVITGARRLTQGIKSAFRYWIPLDAMAVAGKDLSAPLADLLRTPLAFLEGLNRAVRESALPGLTRVVFTVQFANFLLVWQIVAMLVDWTYLRPSYLFLLLAYALMILGYALGYALVSLADWSRLYQRVLQAVQPWFRSGVFDETLQDLTAIVNALHQVPRAFGHGAQVAFGLSANQALTIVILSIAIVAGLLFASRRWWWPTPPPRKEEDDGAGVLM